MKYETDFHRRIPKFDILITTYDALKRDSNYIAKFHYTAVVADDLPEEVEAELQAAVDSACRRARRMARRAGGCASATRRACALQQVFPKNCLLLKPNKHLVLLLLNHATSARIMPPASRLAGAQIPADRGPRSQADRPEPRSALGAVTYLAGVAFSFARHRICSRLPYPIPRLRRISSTRRTQKPEGQRVPCRVPPC